ncbi:MAG: hypothetical protein ACRDUV_22580 [Pseudonocardiaceae bacterium]
MLDEARVRRVPVHDGRHTAGTLLPRVYRCLVVDIAISSGPAGGHHAVDRPRWCGTSLGASPNRWRTVRGRSLAAPQELVQRQLGALPQRPLGGEVAEPAGEPIPLPPELRRDLGRYRDADLAT